MVAKWRTGEDWSLYILESLAKSCVSYIGIATDPIRRLKEHNDKGKGHHESKKPGSWFTSYNGPWKLVFYI